MKPTLLPLALAVMLAAGVCGCDNPATVAKKSRNELREYQEARSERDYERAIALIKRANDQTFMAIKCAREWKALAESLPVVVTNTVYVTNECTRQHWPEPGQSTPLPLVPSQFPNIWPTNWRGYMTVTTQCQNVVVPGDQITIYAPDGKGGYTRSKPMPLWEVMPTNAVEVEK